MKPPTSSAFCKALLSLLCLYCSVANMRAQQYELNAGWECIAAGKVDHGVNGVDISKKSFPLTGWMPATVPGTVLTTLLNNKLIPDPFYGMNNKLIPDIYDSGLNYYTYWFVKDFDEPYPTAGDHIWLTFRGVNYNADVFLNGHKVGDAQGMFLRHTFDITPFMSSDGHNRLAVIVFPPGRPGNANGGQGGDGTIAHCVTNQYTAGWDWIQPIHDRNTGIWDKVFIKRTKQVTISNVQVVTHVPGTRIPGASQAPASIDVSMEVENVDDNGLNGALVYEIEGKKMTFNMDLDAHQKIVVHLPPFKVDNPRLWWPNGYGAQELYGLKVAFLANRKHVSDQDSIRFGIRELQTVWNEHTQSREVHVNGQKIFIKGGNRILSDEMLRFSPERYDAEVRYHRDMNLNLIRVWGGGITERPEFYDACDKYGILVMQDFWVSGDCNGRWYDPMKLEDTTARRQYPDDHKLLLRSMADQVLMLRNHPSLALWCGGNEIRPPADVLQPFKESILPDLDGTRYFFEFSNDDSMSLHGGDGPYTIQPDTFFWTHRSFPFNSEIGSVGIGDYESLTRFLPPEHLTPPYYSTAAHKWIADSLWQYHKYTGYDSSIEAYGHPKDIHDFTMKAQLVNYNQYRALIEGASSHIWDWYTGIIIWKTQNPWTAMLGQMYDVYLDPNACLYGLAEGSKPLHVMYDPIHNAAMTVNNGFTKASNLQLTAKAYSYSGKESTLATVPVTVGGSTAATSYQFGSLHNTFLCLSLTDAAQNKLLDENLYWLPDETGQYSGLEHIPHAAISASGTLNGSGKATVSITTPAAGPIAFFIRVSLVDTKTDKRILPAFCDNNYISVLPGQTRTVQIDYTPEPGIAPAVTVEGWNVDKTQIQLKQSLK